jgi:pimeloyl-ACP methyl ester carboxylesterase
MLGSLPAEERAHMPLVIALDGNMQFDVLKGLAQALQAFAGLPSFGLVSIGYPGVGPLAGELLRARDLAINGCPDFLTGNPFIEEWGGMTELAAGQLDFGHAAEFLDCLAREILPFIQQRFGLGHSERIFMGHSLGGSFGLLCLARHPSLFSHFIINSPASQFHGRTHTGTHYDTDFAFDALRSGLEARRIQNGRLFLSVGELEDTELHLHPWRFRQSFERWSTILRRCFPAPDAFRAETLRGEIHATSWAAAFGRGIRHVLKTDSGSGPPSKA